MQPFGDIGGIEQVENVDTFENDMMELSGTVKSYSLAQGYGFIENVDDIVDGQDVRFNRKDLPGQLTNTQNLQGVSLHFQVKQNRDGKYSAFNIQDPASLPTFSSTLKSWNSQKGFGFIECPPELEELVETEGSGKRDIFLPGKFIVPESHRRHADLAGMAVRFSVEKSNQGLSANFARFVDLPLNEVGSNVPVGQAGKRKTDEGQNDPKKRRKLMGQIPPGRHNGRVSSFVQGKYGFINCDILDQELFFPAGDTNREWQAGEPCSFEIGTDGKTGKLRANGISPQLVPSQRAVAGFASAGTAITGNLERAKQAISACNVAELSELNLFLAQQISFRAMRR
ncbi:unnamed protein product [Amoebophrya sp. A25]|nr:unnamed protein product [Amoebophrya sp. A25]|eukprot:GSA25T00018437001.1